MNIECVQQWIAKVREQADEALEQSNVERSFDLFGIAEEVETWLNNGMTEPLQRNTELWQRHGIQFPEECEETTTATGSSREPLPQQLGQPSPTIRLDPAEVDEAEHRRLLQEAVAALDSDQIKHARVLLKQLIVHATGEIQQSAQGYLRQADMHQWQNEQRSREHARHIAQNHPEDLDQQRAAWTDVLDIAEAGSETYREAEQQLQQLQAALYRQEETRRIRDEVHALRQEIDEAIDKEDYSRLNVGLMVRVDTLTNTATQFGMASEVQALRDRIDTYLDNKQVEFRTLVESGNYEKAYIECQNLIDAGYKVIKDTRVEEFRPAVEVLNEVALELIQFRLEKAGQRRERATIALQDGAPGTALRYYEEARILLTHLELTTEHREGTEYIIGGEKPLPTLFTSDKPETENYLVTQQQLEARRTEIQRTLENTRTLEAEWGKINHLRNEARLKVDPQQALILLREAEAILQQHAEHGLRYSGLDTDIRQRETEIAHSLAQTLRHESANAESAIRLGQFGSARDILAAARARVGAHSSPELDEALRLLDTQLQRIDALEARQHEVQKILQHVEELLAGESNHYTQARELLNQLTEDERKQPKAIILQSDLATKQGEAENWSAAQQAYHAENWPLVISICNEMLSQPGQATDEVRRLHGRASAMVKLDQASTALQAIPPRRQDAQEAYQEGIAVLEQHGTDEQTDSPYRNAKDAIEKIAFYEKNVQPALEAVRRLITTGKQESDNDVRAPHPQLNPRPIWQHAYRKIDDISFDYPPLIREIEQVRAQLLESWRTDYLERIKKIETRDPQVLEQMYTLVQHLKELKDRPLRPEDEYIVNTIELDYLLNQVQIWRQEQIPDYQRIRTNLSRIDALFGMGYRPSNGTVSSQDLQQWQLDAEVSLILDAVRQLVGTAQHEQAISRIEQELHTERFQRHADLIIELIKLYLKSKNFSAAQTYANRLAASNRPDQTDLWEKLVEAARYLNEGSYSIALITYNGIKKRYPEEQAALHDWERYARREAEKLIREANNLGTSQNLDALQKYAYARQLLQAIGEDESIVNQHLERLRSPIINLLAETELNIRELTVRQSLSDAIDQAQRFRERLELISGARDEVNLGPEDQKRLDHAQTFITQRLTLWESVQRLLDDAEAALQLARTKDWEFGEAEEYLKSARQQEAPDVHNRISAITNRIAQYRDWAKQIEREVGELDQAIMDEDFDATIEWIHKLFRLPNSTWQKMLRDFPDQPLEMGALIQNGKLSHTYPYLDEDASNGQRLVTDWEEHLQIAEEARENYQEWDTYVRKLESLQQTARQAAQAAQQSASTEELKKRIVLQEQCVDACAACEAFVNESPDSIKSRKAEVLQREAQDIKRKAQWQQWREAAERQLVFLQQQQQQLARLLDEIQQLRRNMQPSTKRTFWLGSKKQDMARQQHVYQQLEAKIGEATQIDPMAAEIQEALADLDRYRNQNT